MAKKSKTQKAKAAANRAAKKAAKAQQADNVKTEVEVEQTEDKKSKFSLKKESKPAPEKTAAQIRQEKRDAKMAAKENRAPKKHGKIVQFFIDVKAEMKRVTWPEKKDVKQWTGVVIGALVFFGVYVAVLDNFIVTPILVGISSLAS